MHFPRFLRDTGWEFVGRGGSGANLPDFLEGLLLKTIGKNENSLFGSGKYVKKIKKALRAFVGRDRFLQFLKKRFALV